MKISELLTKDRITLDIQGKEKEEVLKELAKLHLNSGILKDFEGYLSALKEREDQSSTALEDGIAIPHAKSEYVVNPALVMGVSKDGVDFDSMDGEKSTLFFMIAAPEDSNNIHIETLARLTQMLLDEDFKEKLEGAKTPEEVIELINNREEWESHQKNLEVTEVEKENIEKPFIVAATACPTGIAHTYMAEGALKCAAEELGVEIRVETNCAEGHKNILTEEEIKRAKGVILAVNRSIDENRFHGKPMVKVSAEEGINNAKKLIQRVLEGECSVFISTEGKKGQMEGIKNKGSDSYKDLIRGMIYMLPIGIIGGVLAMFLSNNFIMYFILILLGSLLSGIILGIFKKK